MFQTCSKASYPFQWSEHGYRRDEKKHRILKDLFKTSKHCTLRIHDMRKSYLEGFSRGDERTGDLIELAWKKIKLMTIKITMISGNPQLMNLE